MKNMTKLKDARWCLPYFDVGKGVHGNFLLL